MLTFGDIRGWWKRVVRAPRPARWFENRALNTLTPVSAKWLTDQSVSPHRQVGG